MLWSWSFVQNWYGSQASEDTCRNSFITVPYNFSQQILNRKSWSEVSNASSPEPPILLLFSRYFLQNFVYFSGCPLFNSLRSHTYNFRIFTVRYKANTSINLSFIRCATCRCISSHLNSCRFLRDMQAWYHGYIQRSLWPLSSWHEHGYTSIFFLMDCLHVSLKHLAWTGLYRKGPNKVMCPKIVAICMAKHHHRYSNCFRQALQVVSSFAGIMWTKVINYFRKIGINSSASLKALLRAL